MLSRLLGLLRAGGTRRLQDLARELDTTPELVRVMLEDLARMGYVGRLTASCNEKCTACPRSGVCAVGGSSGGASSGQTWVFQEGQRDAR
jgi:hypothetical protein